MANCCQATLRVGALLLANHAQTCDKKAHLRGSLLSARPLLPVMRATLIEFGGFDPRQSQRCFGDHGPVPVTRARAVTLCGRAGVATNCKGPRAKLRLLSELNRNGESMVSLGARHDEPNAGPTRTSRLPHFEQRSRCSIAATCFDQFRLRHSMVI